MMKISNIASAFLLGAVVAFSGCGSDGSNDDTPPAVTPTYSLKVTNLTAGQPMSPVLVTTNSIFSVGESASLGLEKLAEGGDNSVLLDAYGVGGAGLLTPGSSETLTLETSKEALSIATMLVKTNDAFAGLDAYHVAHIGVGSSETLYLNVYDAGTEANTETNTTVAAFGVEGFNATRDDSDRVSVHAGVISKDDGLATSALTAMEKFNNPAVAVTITRTK